MLLAYRNAIGYPTIEEALNRANSTENMTFSIAPNPANTNLKVQVAGKADVSYQIQMFDMLGRLQVSKNTLGMSNTDFDVSKFSKGVFFVFVKAQNGVVLYNTKVIIQ
jgi:Secretion system C-terminal sorting domain